MIFYIFYWKILSGFPNGSKTLNLCFASTKQERKEGLSILLPSLSLLSSFSRKHWAFSSNLFAILSNELEKCGNIPSSESL